MKVLNDKNSVEIVKNILSMRGELEIEKGNEKKQFTVIHRENVSRKYMVEVRYRNFPKTESRSQVFNLKELEDKCAGTDMIPVLAFIFYDTEENKIFLALITAEKMKEMAEEDSASDIIKEVEHGIQFKYGCGKKALESYLNQFKNKIDFTEIQRGGRTFY